MFVQLSYLLHCLLDCLLYHSQCGNFIFFYHSILREISLWDYRKAKSAILPNSEKLNPNILWTFARFEGSKPKLTHLRAPKKAKATYLERLYPLKLIPRKI